MAIRIIGNIASTEIPLEKKNWKVNSDVCIGETSSSSFCFEVLNNISLYIEIFNRIETFQGRNETVEEISSCSR